MKKTLLALGLAAILLTGCDGPTKNLTAPKLEAGQISADTRHTMTLDADGNLYANGYNEVGALGNGIPVGLAVGSTVAIATKVLDGVESVDTGYNFTMIVKDDGTLWGTGENSLGQLGLGNVTNVTSFTQAIDSNGNPMTGVANVYTGNGFTLALKDDGTLWGTGQNFHGQLGLGDNIDKNVFTQVTGLGATVSKVATGNFHSLILLSNGDILTTGDNDFGNLGNNDGGGSDVDGVYVSKKVNTFTKVTDEATVGTVVDMAAGLAASFIVNSNGEVYATGNNLDGGKGDATAYSFAKISGVSNVVDVESKWTIAAIVTSDNKLYITGFNNLGQAGVGAKGTNLTVFTEAANNVSKGDRQVSVGNFTSFYIATTSKIYATGDNHFGNLGNGLFGSGTGYSVFTSITE